MVELIEAALVEDPVEIDTSETSLATEEGGLSTTLISHDEAAKIALARFPGSLIEIGDDWGAGRRVWYMEICFNDHIYEMYVDQITGEITYYEWDLDD